MSFCTTDLFRRRRPLASIQLGLQQVYSLPTQHFMYSVLICSRMMYAFTLCTCLSCSFKTEVFSHRSSRARFTFSLERRFLAIGFGWPNLAGLVWCTWARTLGRMHGGCLIVLKGSKEDQLLPQERKKGIKRMFRESFQGSFVSRV